MHRLFLPPFLLIGVTAFAPSAVHSPAVGGRGPLLFALETDASLSGRVFAQRPIALDNNVTTAP